MGCLSVGVLSLHEYSIPYGTIKKSHRDNEEQITLAAWFTRVGNFVLAAAKLLSAFEHRTYLQMNVSHVLSKQYPTRLLRISSMRFSSSSSRLWWSGESLRGMMTCSIDGSMESDFVPTV